MALWALQDAKAKFSALVGEAQSHGPQTVTRRGKAAVVVLSAEAYGRLKNQKGGQGLVSFFKESPLAEVDKNLFARSPGKARSVQL